MIITSPGGFGPEAETRVHCPACGKGMVTPRIGALVKEALKDEPASLPMLNTDLIKKLPDE